MNSSVESRANDTYHNKTILFTGSSGYLSSSLINKLKNIDCRIVRLSRKDSHKPVIGRANFVNLSGNLDDLNVWVKAIKDVDIIYHFSAQTSVYIANSDPIKDVFFNLIPTINLLEACRQSKKTPTILYSGSTTQVGLPQVNPVNESFLDKPISIYDIHKITSENYIEYYSSIGVINGCVLRLSNVYGPGVLSCNQDRGILNKMIINALKGKTLTVYGNGDFIRDYIYVDDVLDAFIKATAEIKNTKNNHYIIGTGKGHQVDEVINLIARKVSLVNAKKISVENIDIPNNLSPIEFRNFIADSSEFSKITGWRAKYNLSEGIDKTISYFNK